MRKKFQKFYFSLCWKINKILQLRPWKQTINFTHQYRILEIKRCGCDVLIIFLPFPVYKSNKSVLAVRCVPARPTYRKVKIYMALRIIYMISAAVLFRLTSGWYYVSALTNYFSTYPCIFPSL